VNSPREYPERDLTQKIIGALIEVHRHLGPGLLESAYEECVCHELMLRDLSFERQKPLAIDYKGHHVECAYRIDLIVEGRVLLELKVVEEVAPIHKAQILTYMRLADTRVGLLVNFNVEILKNGIQRFVL